MTLLITGLVLFLGIHSIGIVANARRDQLAKSLGPLGWRALYSIVCVSAGGLSAGTYQGHTEAPDAGGHQDLGAGTFVSERHTRGCFVIRRFSRLGCRGSNLFEAAGRA